MTLSDLRSYLQAHEQASLSDLALHFKSDPAAVEAAMQTWVRKGKVDVSKPESGCGSSCCKCKSMEMVTIYKWIG